MTEALKNTLLAEAAISLIGIVMNVIQLILIIRQKKTKLAFDLTILSLNIADLLVAIGSTLKSIYICFYLTDVNAFKQTVSTIIEIGTDFCVFSSFFHALFIAMQRFFAVFFPIKFRIYFTKHRCIAGLIAIWIFSILMTGLPYLVKSNGLFHPVIITIIDALLTTFYVIICYRVYYRRTAVSSTMSSTRHDQNSWTLQYSAIVTITFVICTFPYAIVEIRYLSVNKISFHENFEITRSLQITYLMIMLNPALDSGLYFMVNYKKNISRWSLRCCNGKEATMNERSGDGGCCNACFKRDEHTEKKIDSQEKKPSNFEMQQIDADTDAATDDIETTV